MPWLSSCITVAGADALISPSFHYKKLDLCQVKLWKGRGLYVGAVGDKLTHCNGASWCRFCRNEGHLLDVLMLLCTLTPFSVTCSEAVYYVVYSQKGLAFYSLNSPGMSSPVFFFLAIFSLN